MTCPRSLFSLLETQRPPFYLCSRIFFEKKQILLFTSLKIFKYFSFLKAQMILESVADPEQLYSLYGVLILFLQRKSILA